MQLLCFRAKVVDQKRHELALGRIPFSWFSDPLRPILSLFGKLGKPTTVFVRRPASPGQEIPFFSILSQMYGIDVRTFPMPSVFRRWQVRGSPVSQGARFPWPEQVRACPGPGDAVDLPRRRTRLSKNKDPHPISTWKCQKVRSGGPDSVASPIAGRACDFPAWGGVSPLWIALATSSAEIRFGWGTCPSRGLGRDLAQSKTPTGRAGSNVDCAACMPHVTRLREHAHPRPVALTLSSRFCDGRVKACHPLQEHGSYSSLCPRPLLGLSCSPSRQKKHHAFPAEYRLRWAICESATNPRAASHVLIMWATMDN